MARHQRIGRRRARLELQLCEAATLAYELSILSTPRRLEVEAYRIEWLAGGRPSSRSRDLAFALLLEARLLRARYDYITPPWR